MTGSLLVESTGDAISIGAGAAQQGSITFKAPFISSDLVRLAMLGDATLRFTDFFAIRPDARIGDAPPTIQLLSPAGTTFTGGSVVPISWAASDNEGVRLFNIIASYDGEKTWQFIARDLPGTSTS